MLKTLEEPPGNALLILVSANYGSILPTSIGGDDDLRTIDQQQTAGVDAINSRLKDIRFNVEAGQHEVAVLFGLVQLRLCVSVCIAAEQQRQRRRGHARHAIRPRPGRRPAGPGCPVPRATA